MSRHPSPANSLAQPLSNPPTQLSKSKSKQSYPMGITAGAEDVKYQAKYKELKRKVKEIEADNDKLHFKVLTAKRNIQRMKLERAILYERLASIPPSPELNERPLPVMHLRPDGGDMDAVEYMRAHPNATVPPPPHDQGLPPAVPPQMHVSRRSSGGEQRQLPPLPPLPSMLDPPRSPRSSRSHHDSPSMHHERTRSQSSRSQPPPPPQPYHIGTMQYQENIHPMQRVLHSPPPAERERESSRPRRHDLHELAGAAQQQEAHGRVVDHSMPPISPRTHSFDTRSTTRIHNHQRMGPGTYINRDSRERDRDRDLDWERDRERELAYRQRERESSAGTAPMHSPPVRHRSRGQPPPLDYPEHHLPPSRVREEQAYYHDAPHSGPSGAGNNGGTYARVSRSGTPGSGSGSGSAPNDGPSRPDSRSPYYDLDRSRSYRLRPINAPAGEDLDFVHEDGRSHSRDRNSTGGGGGGGNGGGSGSGGFPPPPSHRETDSSGRLDSRREVESRKRNRNDMDVDAEIDEAPAGPGSHHLSSYPSGHLSEERDRGLKRYHRGGGDNIEDVRMGP